MQYQTAIECGTLLLTSAGFENPAIGQLFLNFVGKPAEDVVILFIPTAAINDEAKHCVQLSREELLDLGIRNENIRELELAQQMTGDTVGDYDAIYVCGGTTLHLLQKVTESGFHQTIRDCLAAGKVYVGVSAGSILVGPSVRGTPGLALVDFVVMPHHQGEAERVKELELLTGHRVVPLTDAQAVLIKNGRAELV